MKLIKEIKSKTRELHFRRWWIITLFGKSFYIHVIYKHDEDRYCHSHPWNIWTMILSGSYVEKRIVRSRGSDGRMNSEAIYVTRKFLNKSYLDSEKFHKIERIIKGPVFTLAIVGKRKEHDWGYMTNQGFIDHRTFRKKEIL